MLEKGIYLYSRLFRMRSIRQHKKNLVNNGINALKHTRNHQIDGKEYNQTKVPLLAITNIQENSPGYCTAVIWLDYWQNNKRYVDLIPIVFDPKTIENGCVTVVEAKGIYGIKFSEIFKSIFLKKMARYSWRIYGELFNDTNPYVTEMVLASDYSKESIEGRYSFEQRTATIYYDDGKVLKCSFA
jgi:hypothetical protein